MLEVPAVRNITERRIIANQAGLRQLAGVTVQRIRYRTASFEENHSEKNDQR